MPVRKVFKVIFLYIYHSVNSSRFWKITPEMDKFLLFNGAKAGMGDNRNADTIVLLNNSMGACS